MSIDIIITANNPIIAAYNIDLSKPNLMINKKYTAGITVLNKPMNEHKLNDIGSFCKASSVLQ